ncbi:MAG TPA: TIGR02680 family protein [Solirubrobacteraceae bacterium]|nr:TIGR02680 family protein [Solirubrobacteraceae bacterium]
MSRLPAPARERWQPLRLGLVDLFYYDREEFAFRDGRLLLRGNNGTGKSKVLALTLPFLLDGDLSAHRVEPDADPNKRMDWNLLLGGEHPNDERLGYAWLEFGRAGEEGAAFCTIGCGMKAAKGRGITGHWFFVTEQRVGEDLTLVDATGVALTVDRLEDAIGSRGGVHRRARDYRRAIDERLFGLGDVRYGALIDLLIKIRAPQLSKRPDERSLSAALTGALPPLDQALIADVAEAFRALEEDGEQLAAMIEARDASQRYLTTYRAYARMATRRRAAPVRQAQTVFDRVSRELAEAEEQHARAQAALAQARETLDALRAERTRLDARRQALQDDPAARSAQELRRAGADAEQTNQRRAEAQSAVDRLQERVGALRDRVVEAEAEETAAVAKVTAMRAEATDHARRARIATAVTEVLVDADPDELRRRAGTLTGRQQTAIDCVRALVRRWQRARDALAEARASTEQLASEHAGVTARRDDALARVRDASADYSRAVRTHLDGASELSLPDPAAAFAALEAWLQTVSGANPLELAAAAAGRDAARRIERAQVQAGARAEEARATTDELEREIEELESGVHPRPPVPYTRAADAREQRAGAPLWQLLDFRDDVSPDDRAGLEAALEAAGILDGWVTPSGELLDPDTEDVLLAAVDGEHAGPRLTEALVPAIGEAAGVSEAEVHRLLETICLGESDAPVWVSGGGRFRNGILRGAWHKPAAAFIGHSAREAARQARLAELHDRAAAARVELAALEQEIAELTRRHAQLERELTELPSDTAVREADGALAAVEAELAALARRLDSARARERQAQGDEDTARGVLQADAADLDLPPGGEELAEVEAALGSLRETLAALWPAYDQRRRAEHARVRAAEDVGTAVSEHAETAGRLAEAEHQLAAAVERRDTLQATAGAAIAELERRLGEVAGALAANEAAQHGTEERLGEAQRADGAAEALSGELRGQLETATESRLSATEGLRRFATTGLIAVALRGLETIDPGGEWNVTGALRLAREIEQALAADPDEDARWQRLQRQVTDELGALADALRRHGNNAAASFREEGIVVEVTFRARTTSLPALATALTEEVEERQRLLDAHEREVLENHLVGEVASTLQELITAAERRVADTNRELAERPTSTGMQLRLRWMANPDGPDGLADARARLLRQSADAWSEADRAAVGGFLQNQIKAVRAQDATGTWLEHLTRALDYRGWHRFAVERRQGAGWCSASGPASGGERVLAASVPLFAAASSYYSSAGSPHAPRLVLLDEAFAGVDDRARAKCLGLLAAFDLDVVMTSEREWGCYAEVPGLAIAQLSRIDGVAAVLVSRWEWDGAERMRVEPAPESPLITAAPPPDGPPLWDTSITSD